jgi:hypothetical protein
VEIISGADTLLSIKSSANQFKVLADTDSTDIVDEELGLACGK